MPEKGRPKANGGVANTPDLKTDSGVGKTTSKQKAGHSKNI